MTDATKLIAGILLISVPTIEFGGTFLLSILSGKHSEFTGFQRSMFRAGHAHAGVLVILALVAQVFTDQANLSAPIAWAVRIGFVAAPILVSGGFFGAANRQRQDPAGRIHLAAVDRRFCAGRKSDRAGNRPDSGTRVNEMTTNGKKHGIVLITGASSGIGRELALEFGAGAETLVLVARRLDRLERLREELLGRYPELKVVALAADLSDEHEIERLLTKVSEQAGAVDVLVNNAGLGDSVLFDRSQWARTRQLLRTNIFALAQLTSALLPAMVERRRGGVLNIGSGAGLTVVPNAAAYVGSKHFVAGFSEALRADLSGAGVTVTQVCPGPVESEFDQVSGSPEA